MARFEAEFAERQLAEVSTILSAWYTNRDSTSRRIQYLRDREMGAGRWLLQELIYGVMPERRLQLQAGEQPVEAVQFIKGAYGMYSMRNRLLEPGAALTLQRAEERIMYEGVETYVGDHSLMVAVSSLARAIHERSQLVIAEMPVIVIQSAAPIPS